MRLYESMFLVQNARAREDIEGVVRELKELVTRAGGEVVNCAKWDERKLAYKVGGQRRGTYVLCHWNGPPAAPAKLERQSRLSGLVLRVLNIVDEDGIEIVKPREDFAPRRGREGSRDREKPRETRSART